MFRLFDVLLEGVEADVTDAELEEAIGAGQGIISHQRRTNTDLSFVNVLRSVRYICPGEEHSKMEEFIEAFTNENNLRVSVEYALSIRNFELCERLLDKLTGIGKVKNLDWVKTYEIVKSFQKRELSLEKLEAAIVEHKPKNLETRTLTKLMKCYVHFYKQNWVDIKEIIPQLREDIQAIKNEYTRSTFTIRLNELDSHIQLHAHNNVEAARELVKKTNESEFSFKFNLHTHYILGQSYMLEDYETSLSHLERYVEELRKCGDHGTAEKVIMQDIAFLKNHWGVPHEIDGDLAEQIHQEYKRGNIEKAKELMEELEKEGTLSPFQMYYKGLIENNVEILMESLLDFINKGDFYFANLPLKILQADDVLGVTANMIYVKLLRREEKQ